MADPRVGDWVLARSIPHLSDSLEQFHLPQWVRITDHTQGGDLCFGGAFARHEHWPVSLGFGLADIVPEDDLTDNQLAERARLYLTGEGS